MNNMKKQLTELKQRLTVKRQNCIELEKLLKENQQKFDKIFEEVVMKEKESFFNEE